LLDNSGSIVYQVYNDKGRGSIERANLQLKQIATYSWAMAHQSLSNLLLPAFLCMLLVSKGAIHLPTPALTIHTTIRDQPTPIVFDEDEFVGEQVRYGFIEQPVITEKYYQDIVDLEEQIQ
jgi:hypothetical protein